MSVHAVYDPDKFAARTTVLPAPTLPATATRSAREDPFAPTKPAPALAASHLTEAEQVDEQATAEALARLKADPQHLRAVQEKLPDTSHKAMFGSNIELPEATGLVRRNVLMTQCQGAVAEADGLLDNVIVALDCNSATELNDAFESWSTVDRSLEKEKIGYYADPVHGEVYEVEAQLPPARDGSYHVNQDNSMLDLLQGQTVPQRKKKEVVAPLPPGEEFTQTGVPSYVQKVTNVSRSYQTSSLFFNRNGDQATSQMNRHPVGFTGFQDETPHTNRLFHVPATQRNCVDDTNLPYTEMPENAPGGEDVEGEAQRRSRILGGLKPSRRVEVAARGRPAVDAATVVAPGGFQAQTDLGVSGLRGATAVAPTTGKVSHIVAPPVVATVQQHAHDAKQASGMPRGARATVDAAARPSSIYNDTPERAQPKVLPTTAGGHTGWVPMMGPQFADGDRAPPIPVTAAGAARIAPTVAACYSGIWSADSHDANRKQEAISTHMVHGESQHTNNNSLTLLAGADRHVSDAMLAQRLKQLEIPVTAGVRIAADASRVESAIGGVAAAHIPVAQAPTTGGARVPIQGQRVGRDDRNVEPSARPAATGDAPLWGPDVSVSRAAETSGFLANVHNTGDAPLWGPGVSVSRAAESSGFLANVHNTVELAGQTLHQTTSTVNRRDDGIRPVAGNNGGQGAVVERSIVAAVGTQASNKKEQLMMSATVACHNDIGPGWNSQHAHPKAKAGSSMHHRDALLPQALNPIRLGPMPREDEGIATHEDRRQTRRDCALQGRMVTGDLCDRKLLLPPRGATPANSVPSTPQMHY